MSAAEAGQPSDFQEAGQRPNVTEYDVKPDFHVGDKVYFINSSGSREGPYIVASVDASMRKCTLSLETGQAVKNGEKVKMESLEAP